MIVILVGYGAELEVYKNCRKVWELYAQTIKFEDIKIFFCQTASDAKHKITAIGHDLILKAVSKSGITHINQLDRQKSAITWGDWTIDSNTEMTERQKESTKWVLHEFDNECTHIYYTTITSLLHTQALKTIATKLPYTRLYAGSLCKFRESFLGITGFTFASGAGTLVTRDVAELICRNTSEDYLGLPNDVWLGLKLRDLNRVSLPRYDFERQPYEINFDALLTEEISAALKEGHFHFRAKSKQNRELIDHLILLEVYKAISLDEYIERNQTVVNLKHAARCALKNIEFLSDPIKYQRKV
jgi:hypothetical protein